MIGAPLPYFFDEALLASKARQPGDREKALGMTMADLNWLNNVYLATDSARVSATSPMHVKRLLLSLAGKDDIPLAGAFAMSRPDDGEVTLYTPYKGLIKFTGMDDLQNTLKQWLAHHTGKLELLRFLSIEQRATVLAASEAQISTQDIDGAVFQDQERILDLNQQHNIDSMIGALVKLPHLQSMLDELLKISLRQSFPNLDQRLTRLKSFVRTDPVDGAEHQHIISSISLSDALLHVYLTNQWPAGDSRVFAHPELAVSSDADNQAWESVIQEIAQSLTPHLEALLESFWNTPVSGQLSPLTLFTEGMQDTYEVKLLLQRQNGVVTTQEYAQLANLDNAPVTSPSLRIEKVRVSAPFKPYVELASSLMIGSSDSLGFLYTQSRGIEATTDLAAVKKIVLQMLQSQGHEDAQLNVMSLDERGLFLAQDPQERVITGEPVRGPVFEQLMADILAKQRQNLSYALSLYRASEGTLNPHALLDKTLDVRGLIDDRLLAANAAGRWSTHADLRWNAQPATVRAESAKEQLASLDSVAQALRQRLDNYPAIAATTETVTEAQRIVDPSLAELKSSFSNTLSIALRSELKLRAVDRTLGETEQTIIKTLLDTPVRLHRAALNGFLPDVFSLALKASDATAPLKLASCFVLTERGGLDPAHSGKTILWTPAFGYEVFKALPALLSELARRLSDHRQRLTLLENLGRGERHPGKHYTLAPPQRIDGNFLDEVQKNHVHLDQTCVVSALATLNDAASKASLLSLVALRQPLTGLHRAMDIARSLTTRQRLPAWLGQASIKDLRLHGELLQQYLNNVKDDQDYLTGTDSLRGTARVALEQQLKADTFNIDPDKIQIHVNARPMIAASTQTLTDFALTHLKDLEQIHLTAVSLDSTVIPQKMDERYIKDLIKNLDAGKRQQRKITVSLADTPANAERRKRFFRQVPWQLMHYAHCEKMQERLSESAFDLVRQVIDMPDAIARAAVDGAHAMIRPLEFMGLSKGQTTTVPGVYLIGSSASDSSRQVLLAPHSPRHGLKEYENEQQLLAELKTRGALFDWLLTNLPQTDRTLLESHLAPRQRRAASSEPAPKATPADGLTLASRPIKGNLLKHLLKDNVALLGRLLGCQAEDKKQSEWATIKQVMGEDLQAASTFCMGRLAYPLTVWRSYRDIKQSAEDLQTHHWGKALTEFISGIAELATLRQSLEPEVTAPSPSGATPPVKPKTATQWQDIDITATERTHLKRYESHDVDLGSLTFDSKLHLYQHPTTKNHYAPVAGKVYPVTQGKVQWRIGPQQTPGPKLRLAASRQWLVAQDTKPRFGLLRRLETLVSVWDGMNVDANGMPAIRRRYPQKAREIQEALDLATTYTWNSFRNLQLLKTSGSTDTPVHRLVKDFIDVSQVLPKHIEMLEKVVGEIFTALLDPTLRKEDSRRFALGRVITDPDGTFAFTVPRDAKRKIYLAERFFAPQFDLYKPHLTDTAFPISAHARASTLVHELSHIACETEDIAYLDASRPFVDLIGSASATASDMKNELSKLQDTALSTKTPYTELFMTYDPDTGERADMDATAPAALRVLSETGAENLSGARTVFKKNALTRLAVQLANADSVAWLICHLGRQLHVTTP
jgi:hypothetical protein